MRPTAYALVLFVAFLAAPARAQFRDETSARPAAVAVYDTPSVPGGLNLGRLFNAQTLQLSHQAEFSTTTGGAGTLGLGVYTTSLQWQPSARLAGRVDVAVAKNLFSSGALGNAYGADESPQLYLRNAELAYRPTANSVLHLSIQQSPYGTYASPYGYADPFGNGYSGNQTGFRASVGSAGADRLFFRNGQ
ncbi:MAG TPA: hypothetical protein VF576_00515 [Rubricoccaceae bacterium]|jgi:hypothetical protein